MPRIASEMIRGLMRVRVCVLAFVLVLSQSQSLPSLLLPSDELPSVELQNVL